MIQAIIDRLKAGAPTLVAVLPAEDIDALSKGTAPRSATAFVLPYREQAEPNEQMSGAFRQIIAVQFLVAFIIRRHDDAQGGAKVAIFDTVKAEIEQALAGWSFVPEAEPCELVAAQAAPLGNGVTAYVQTWQTSRYLET
ncbi:phage tail terminator protein [Shinella sp. M31]|uniref:phage tail terminator protein n=1 Tax=Shinella sp. M31 TaxID=3368615 RepID=UPI003BA16789